MARTRYGLCGPSAAYPGFIAKEMAAVAIDDVGVAYLSTDAATATLRTTSATATLRTRAASATVTDSNLSE